MFTTEFLIMLTSLQTKLPSVPVSTGIRQGRHVHESDEEGRCLSLGFAPRQETITTTHSLRFRLNLGCPNIQRAIIERQEAVCSPNPNPKYVS
jgi:hypothetical protein